MKGRNGIHLDNKEHAILEHCVGSNGNKLSNKSLATELNIIFFIESDHLECAKAHHARLEDGSQGNDFKTNANVDVRLDTVCFFMNNIKH